MRHGPYKIAFAGSLAIMVVSRMMKTKLPWWTAIAPAAGYYYDESVVEEVSRWSPLKVEEYPTAVISAGVVGGLASMALTGSPYAALRYSLLSAASMAVTENIFTEFGNAQGRFETVDRR